MTATPTPPRRRTGRGPALLAAVLLAGMAVLGVAVAAPAGASPTDDPMGPPSTTYSPPTSALPGQPGSSGADCGPGNIVRFPNCGKEPASKDDPGGWLQVSLFFLVCAAIVVIGLAVAWRARAARERRRRAGLDPLQLARARGEGVRRPPSPSSP